MMKMIHKHLKKLIDFFPDYQDTDSLFYKMALIGAPWDGDVGHDMDAAYFTMYSGVKHPSDFVKLNSNNDIAKTAFIANLLWSMYGHNWKRLWDGFVSEYNPIDNYNLTEKIVRDETDDRDIDRTSDSTDIVDSTDTTTYGRVVNTNDTVDNSTYGFNSEEPTPTSKSVSIEKENNSGNDEDKVDSTDTVHSTDKSTDNNVEHETVDRTRAGNVGQNTYQELLRQEFELWKWNFFTQVFDDVDKFLCLSIYQGC